MEWVFLSQYRSKNITKPQELMAQLVRKARASLQELKSGCDFTCIQLPVNFSGYETPLEKLTK